MFIVGVDISFSYSAVYSWRKKFPHGVTGRPMGVKAKNELRVFYKVKKGWLGYSVHVSLRLEGLKCLWEQLCLDIMHSCMLTTSAQDISTIWKSGFLDVPSNNEKNPNMG